MLVPCPTHLFPDSTAKIPTTIPARANRKRSRRRGDASPRPCAGRRLAMFLDYDGTLREIEADPAAAAPTPAVSAVLDALARDGRADVTIISGRTPQDLEAFLGRYPFGIIAEHGATVRRPHSGEWEHLDQGLSYEWLAEVRDVMSGYASSLPGSFVEEKRTSLVWHFRRCDEGEGGRKARQLADQLAPHAARHGLSVRHGKKIIEVTPTAVSKGAAVLRVIDEAPGVRPRGDGRRRPDRRVDVHAGRARPGVDPRRRG